MTKLHCLLTLLIVCSLGMLHAAPAKNTPITVTEPDGSTLTVYLHGDEYFSWRTTSNGTPIVKCDGYYHYALYQANGEVSATSQRVVSNGTITTPNSSVVAQEMESIARTAMATKRAESRTTSVMTKAAFPTNGTIKSIAILVEFQDVKFTTEEANTAFYNMLNLEGYSENGSTGSARDYFAANSGGTYIGDFDVYGVYTLDNDCAYYGGNSNNGGDIRPQQLAIDAVAKCDADGVDFSQYDYDNDGYIDNVFIYYAGYNEAEGGDEDTVWPHRYYVYDNTTYDGKVLYGYACSSELRSNSGTTMAGIGTFCHEFSHVLGLADHYDTDGSTNGTSVGLGTYDIMSSGNYNNDGCTPPMYNALELDIAGWCTPTVVEGAEAMTLAPLQYYDKKTLRINTEVEGEYFLIEARNQDVIVWENYIAANGLFIYHVDRSDSYMSYWSNNAPNADTSHECFKFVVASNISTSSQLFTWAKVPYPYMSNNAWSATSSPKAESWGGVVVDYQLQNIARTGDNYESVYLEIIEKEQLSISGIITDANTGVGVSSATITLTSLASGIEYTTTTTTSGWYELDKLPDGNYDVTIIADDYSTYTDEIALTQGVVRNFEMTCLTNYLGYHNGNGMYGFTVDYWHKGYITLNDSKLAGLEGNAITAINIYLTTSFGGGTVGITPSNSTMVSKEITKTVSGNSWQYVDMSEFELYVEEGVTYEVSIEGESPWTFVVDDDTSGEYDGLSNMMQMDANGRSFTINEVTGGSCLGNILIELVVTNTTPEVDNIAQTTESLVAPRVRASKGTLYVQSSEPIQQVAITTLQGGCVRTINRPGESIHVADLAKGIYLIILTDAFGRYTSKIVL